MELQQEEEQQKQQQQQKRMKELKQLKQFIQKGCPADVKGIVVEFLCGNDVNRPKGNKKYTPFMNAIRKGDYSQMILSAEVHPIYFKDRNDDEEKNNDKNRKGKIGDEDDVDGSKNGDNNNNPGGNDMKSANNVITFDINKQKTKYDENKNDEDPKYGMGALLLATHLRKPNTMKYLIRRGSHIDAGSAKFTSLQYACQRNFDAEAQILIKYGADVNAMIGRNLDPPLHHACTNENLSLAELLLKHGADVDAEDINGRMPLLLCIKRKFDLGLKLLLKYDANMEAIDRYGNSPLCLALDLQRDGVAKLLIQNGANVNNYVCFTPLHFACGPSFQNHDWQPDPPMIESLLERGANVNGADGYGWTPLFHLLNNANPQYIFRKKESKAKDVVELLISKGANTDCWMKAIANDAFHPKQYILCSFEKDYNGDDDDDDVFAAKVQYCIVQKRYYFGPVDTSPWKKQDSGDLFELGHDGVVRQGWFRQRAWACVPR